MTNTINTDLSSTAPEQRSGLPRFARLPVLSIAGALALLLLITSAMGGYQFQELYFIEAGRRFAWGYADQPWLVPLIASTLDKVFGGSMLGLRLPSTVVGALSAVVTSLIARELGGARTAQTLAAATYATAWGTLSLLHILATTAIDPFWWLMVLWLVVRWVSQHQRGERNDRLLLWAGVVTAVAMQTKFLIPVLWVALAGSVLLVGPRELLRRSQLWLGAAITLLASLPTLIWQASHGWPNLVFTQAVGERSQPIQLVLTLPILAGLIGTVFLGYAVWRLFRSAPSRPYRFLAWTALAVIAMLMLLDGRAYYPVGLYGALFAVAAVEIERRGLPRWVFGFAWPLYLVAGALTVSFLAGSTTSTGAWTHVENAKPTANAFHSLPPVERSHTAIVAEDYSVAATLQHHAPRLGIPPIYSPHRGWFYFGAPPANANATLYVGSDPGTFQPFFAEVRPVGAPGSHLWLLDDRKQSWEVIWPRVQSGLSRP